MKIVILNTHSILNSGDTAIVTTQLKILTEIVTDAQISITSRTPDLDRAYYEPQGVTVYPPITPTPSVYRGKANKLYRSVKLLIAFRQKWRLIRAIAKADLIIASGGGYFFSNHRYIPGPMFIQNVLHIKIAQWLKKPIIFFPQSFGPLANGCSRRILRHLLNHPSGKKVFCREKISQKLVGEMRGRSDPIHQLCPDLAFSHTYSPLAQRSPVDIDLQKPVMALTLRKWRPAAGKGEDPVTQDRYLKVMSMVCEHVSRIHDASIVIFSQVRGPGEFEDDRDISRTFFSNLQDTIPEWKKQFIDIKPSSPPETIFDILKETELLLSTRFHPVIFACLIPVPAIAISYQPKSRGIMEMLGLEEYCFDFATLKENRLLEAVDRILANREAIKRQMQDRATVFRNQIKNGISRAIIPISQEHRQ